MDYKMLPLYFLLGGVVVALVTYFGSQARGTLAAFVALFPSVTVITLYTVYQQGGIDPAISYARGLVFLVPAWLVYILAVIYLLPKLGFFIPVVLGVALYIGIGYLFIRFT